MGLRGVAPLGPSPSPPPSPSGVERAREGMVVGAGGRGRKLSARMGGLHYLGWGCAAGPQKAQRARLRWVFVGVFARKDFYFLRDPGCAARGPDAQRSMFA